MSPIRNNQFNRRSWHRRRAALVHNQAKPQESHAPHRFERMLDVSDQSVIELDRNRLVLWANHTCEVVLGVQPESMQGLSLGALLASSLIPTGSSPSLTATLIDAQYPLSGEALYRHPTGRHRMLRWSVWPATKGDAAGTMVVTFTDLSERQEAEEKLAALVEDFLSVLQHRLNTPVLANVRVSELLLDGAFGSLNEQQTETLLAMRDNSRDISRLLSILLDLYRYKNNRANLNLEDCAVTDLLVQPISELKSGCLKRGIQLQLKINDGQSSRTNVRVDRAEISKLLKHLTENALRHARSSVSISVVRTNNHVDIAVADDGRGIAPEDLPNLFTRFFQASASGRYAPVTGAGLCLCSEIARAHGGFLSCKSRIDQGARFTLTLSAV